MRGQIGSQGALALGIAKFGSLDGGKRKRNGYASLRANFFDVNDLTKKSQNISKFYSIKDSFSADILAGIGQNIAGKGS